MCMKAGSIHGHVNLAEAIQKGRKRVMVDPCMSNKVYMSGFMRNHRTITARSAILFPNALTTQKFVATVIKAVIPYICGALSVEVQYVSLVLFSF